MEGQSVPCEPLGKYLQDFLSVLPILEAEHGVIGVADFKRLAPEARLHLALEPFVEHKVKVHVGEQRADNLPLPGPRLAHQQPSVVNDSDVDPLPYQSEDACVAYPPLNHLHEMFSHDGVEGRHDRLPIPRISPNQLWLRANGTHLKATRLR